MVSVSEDGYSPEDWDRLTTEIENDRRDRERQQREKQNQEKSMPDTQNQIPSDPNPPDQLDVFVEQLAGLAEDALEVGTGLLAMGRLMLRDWWSGWRPKDKTP